MLVVCCQSFDFVLVNFQTCQINYIKARVFYFEVPPQVVILRNGGALIAEHNIGSFDLRIFLTYCMSSGCYFSL